MHDVIVIGAGPAGLSAAIACRKWGLDVVVVDEFMKPGGRLLGQLHQEPDGQWWNGIEEANKLVTEARELNTDIRCGLSVYHIEKNDHGFRVYTNETVFNTEFLLLATGAAEIPAPIPGWTLPGVMSVGAAQVMTNVHRVRVGDKGIIIGINVLSVAIARELQLAGIDIHSMALPAINPVTRINGNPKKVIESLVRIAHLAPSAFIRLGSKFAKSTWMRNVALRCYPKNGVKMWGIPIHLRKAILQINGVNHVESVTICDIDVNGQPIAGTEDTVAVDFVLIAGGLSPLVELAAIAGCQFHYVEELGGYLPIHNERLETQVEGLFVAGNITGIEGAKVCMAQGTLAGLSIVQRKRQGVLNLEQKITEAIEDEKITRKNAIIQFHQNIEKGRAKVYEKFQQNQLNI